MEKKNRILIADDDPRNIFALRLTLQSKGYECICAAGAEEAIAIAKTEKSSIAVILMDMMMPGMDGYQAITILRENEETAQIPIIAVTAQAMPGDKEKCLEAGANNYVSKPVNVDHLLEIIHAHAK
ncbi:MAG: response regulator [Chitinophagaceae bacterium]